MKKLLRSEPFQWLEMLLGLIVSASAYRMFLIPNDIAPGGFTGIGQLINSFTGWPIGTVALCLNIPLFALSLRSLGLRFGLKSLIASIGLSLFIDYLPVPAATADPMLGALFGGVMGGAGFGLILRGNATTGGSDMLAKLIVKRIPMFKIGMITFCVDAMVIVASAFVFDATKALLALVASYLMNHVLDSVLEGPNLAKCYFIISSKNEEIARRILSEMDRGVTRLEGRGMYSGDPRPVLFCVIGRMETMRLRQIVADVDSSAFMIATDVHEALGEGFQPHEKSKPGKITKV